jgi:lipoate-protein ligase B
MGLPNSLNALPDSAAEICVVYRLGSLPYQRAWRLQETLARKVAAGEHPPALLLLQHPHTFTFGRRGRIENLLWSEAELAEKGVEVVWSDRGGDVTYHGPGQLVGYPLLPLAPGGLYAPPPQAAQPGTASPAEASEKAGPLAGQAAAPASPRLPQADYIGYLRRLEQALILALLDLGVAAGQLDGLTGVWVQPDALSRCRSCAPELRRRPAKIAAIGVKVDARGVSRHGFALNVDPDMSYWDGIVGCGLADYGIAGLADLLQRVPSMPRVEQAVTAAFGQVFAYAMVDRPAAVILNEVKE